MGKAIGVVLFMPRMLCSIVFALLEFIIPVLGCFFVVEETHEGTVRHEGHDAFGFVIPEFKSADPDKNDKDSHPDHPQAEPLRVGRNFQKAVKQAGKSLHHIRFSLIVR